MCAAKLDHTVLDVEQSKNFLRDHPSGSLINVLTPQQYARQHLPGSKQACIFETAFLEHMAAIAPNKSDPVLLYGAGDSMDVITASQKLQEAGYGNIYIFPGGIDAWRAAGYTLEGEAPEAVDAPYPPLVPLYSRYKLLPGKSRLAWVGRSDSHQHWGTVGFKQGELTFSAANGIGSIVIDMTNIQCTDLATDKTMHQVLLDHLASPDFFLIKHFPETVLEITDLYPKPGLDEMLRGSAEALPNYYGRAAVKIRNNSKLLEGELSLRNLADGLLSLTGQLELDRTNWGIIYGSARFFRFLGMHKVDDLISLDAMMIFKADGPAQKAE